LRTSWPSGRRSGEGLTPDGRSPFLVADCDQGPHGLPG
jgi:hypothetical protein